MLDRNYRDIVAGFGLTLTGATAALYAISKYSMGTVTRMGPGMMPASLGAILAVFGLVIAIPALFRGGERIDIRLRALIALSASIISFMLLIETFGLVPAVFSTAIIATFAEAKVTLRQAMILGAAMSFMTWAVFILGLRLSISAFDWPF